MLIPFLAIQARILDPTIGISDVQNVLMWNNNVEKLLNGEDRPYQLDAVFVEFPEPIKWDQLGDGVQIVDPLFIKLHYVSDFTDAQDGTQDQNLDIFPKLDALRDLMQDWMPTTFTIGANDTMYSKYAGTYDIKFGVWQRVTEYQDKDHSNVYHFVQEYATNWVDEGRERPVGGSLSGPVTGQFDTVTAWATGNLYTAAVPVTSYVTYLNKIYKCILDTTVAYELPTNVTYFTFVANQYTT